MIPTTKLDDRTFDDIVAEAKRLIPRYCPEWTNHNPSDPGMTLVELFSWMTEMTLYRLNKIPEKTYLALLELIGMSLIPPRAARAIIQFFPVNGYHRAIPIKKGFQVAAISEADEGCIFETEKEIKIGDAKLVSCVDRYGEQWAEHIADDTLHEFSLFESHNSVEHILYLSSPSFAYLRDGHHVQIVFSEIQELASVKEETVKHLYWEYWDGRIWNFIRSSESIKKRIKRDNVIYISGPIDIQPCSVQGVTGMFLRAVLSDIPDNTIALQTKHITLRTFFEGAGFLPDLCLQNSGSQYFPVDMNATFRLFSENPSYNEMFYLSADAIFSQKNTYVHITFAFSEIYVPGNENENALFAYEYWNGSAWIRFSDKDDFKDTTFNFKQAGEISFIIPASIARATVNNEERYWIRIRLLTKDFALGGTFVKDATDNWEWKFSAKVHSPLFNQVRISYDAKPCEPDSVFSYSNFTWKALPELTKGEEKSIYLFDMNTDTSPSLFLGFSAAFPDGDTAVYFKLDEEYAVKPQNLLAPIFSSVLESKKEKRLINFQWEYWNGTEWAVLPINDYTDSFHESGFIEFNVSGKIQKRKEFGKELYWMRIRLLSGSFEFQPKIQAILTNAVYACNRTRYENEIAGSATGAPGQSVPIAHGPVLSGLQLSVNEGSIPPANELELMKKEGIAEPYIKEEEAVWVKYREVENFYGSTPFSRHFVIDYKNNRIFFGDGQHGINPPIKKAGIRIDSYTTGGGSAGNVAPHTLRVMAQNIPFIAGCDNPFGAEGGSDMEDTDNLKSRAAGVFKSVARAVTTEDFEWLARESSASVGRAHCLKEKNTQGEICVIIVPSMTEGTPLDVKRVPSKELIRCVVSYLNERKLVGTKIRVQEPVYRSFSAEFSLVFRSDVLDEGNLKKKVENTLREYFHVLKGGEGNGWEFGREITKGAVLKQLEKIDGLLSINDVILYDKDADIIVEKLLLKPDEVPFLQDVVIRNRKATE